MDKMSDLYFNFVLNIFLFTYWKLAITLIMHCSQHGKLFTYQSTFCAYTQYLLNNKHQSNMNYPLI